MKRWVELNNFGLELYVIVCDFKLKLFNLIYFFMDYFKYIWRKLSIKYIYCFIVKIICICIYMNIFFKEKFFSIVYIYKK